MQHKNYLQTSNNKECIPLNILSEGAVLSSVQKNPDFSSKDSTIRSSNDSIMCYDMKIRMPSHVMVMNVTIGNKQITQIKE